MRKLESRHFQLSSGQFLWNCPNIGLDLETSNAQNSGPYYDLAITGDSRCTNCDGSTVAVKVNIADAAFRGIDGITVNYSGVSAHPHVGIDSYAVGAVYANIHCEGVGICLDLHGGGNRVENVNCSSNVMTCVQIESDARNNVIDDVYSLGTNLILDKDALVTITSSPNHDGWGEYVSGREGSCVMSSSRTCSSPAPVGSHCMASVVGKSPMYGACSISANILTVTASAPNSHRWTWRVVD